jgi:ubiquinone/menaquinone biosynthesis C-methylase UbiE
MKVGEAPAQRPDPSTAEATLDHRASFEDNRLLWDAWTAVHATGDFYDLAGFRAGGVRLREDEVAAVGDVHGRTVLHLQCHFGIDTLSWARLGAKVTGVDFSPAAIALARELAADLGLGDARFIESNVYDLPANLDETFDVVYTSRGVIGWLPDIAAWARVVARFVAPGGRFYMSEIHPIAHVFESEHVAVGELRLAYPYWEHREPLVFDVQGSYADPGADIGTHREHGWNRSLGEIVTALIAAGLRLDWLRESPVLDWATDYLVELEPGSGRYGLPPEARGELPLMFSLMATRPA